jgi:thioredoxin 1
MAPVIERMARDHGLAVVGVDVGASAALASQHGVRSLPTVMLFEGGRLTGTAVGPMARARLTQQLGLADPLIVQLEGEVEHGAG